MMNRIAQCCVLAVFGLMVATAADAATEIQWWHSMTSRNGELVNKIASDFNAKQSQYKIVPVYKGQYAQSLAAAIAAYRAGHPPAIVQVYEVGTQTMMSAKGAIKPVYEVMKAGGGTFNQDAYIPAIRFYYSDPEGRMLSMPFNSSTPVLYYNKEAFKKAGLADQAPRTWPDFVADAKKLKASGSTCPFTTSWQSWVQLENFSAWHNVPIANNGDGFDGLATKLLLNGPLQVRHISNMQKWHNEGLFVYGGRADVPAGMFYSGKCAMLFTSSGAYGNIVKNSKFKFGVGELPYYPDVKGAPQNSIIGGATLWVMAGQPENVYKGVAKFFTYLSSPEVQAEWSETTGYLPVTTAAYDYIKKQGYYAKHPGSDVAIKQLTNKPPTANSKGIRLGNFVQIRNVINEELEAIWNNKKTAKQGLDDIVKRGDEWLAKFAAANK
jgi:sn-glycerol 3-phosphate transport system substrate-binding protein